MSDFQIALELCATNAKSFADLSEPLRRNRDVILAAFKARSAHLWEFIPRDLQQQVSEDRELMLAAVASFGLTLFHACPTLKDDRELVKVAVTDSCDSLRYASWRLRQDRNLALYAARQESPNLDSPLGCLSQELRDDREVVAAFCGNISKSLEFAPAFQDDSKMVMLAIERGEDGRCLEFASDRLKDDKDVVLAAITQDECGDALEYASTRLRGDEEVVRTAFDNLIFDGLTQHLSLKLRDSIPFICQIAREGLSSINGATERVLNSPELKAVVLHELQHTECYVKYTPQSHDHFPEHFEPLRRKARAEFLLDQWCRRVQSIVFIKNYVAAFKVRYYLGTGMRLASERFHKKLKTW